MMGSQHHRHGRGRGPSRHEFSHLGFGHGRPEGRRARRGDIRAAILALLGEEPMHGYEMIQQIEERTNGIWRPSAGSIYPTLQLLEDEGLISGEEVDGKRRFTLTDEGRKTVEGSTEPPPWEQVVDDTGDGTRALVREFQKLMPAFKEVVRSGSDAQKTKAIAVLADARRQIYASLGEDD